METETMKEKRRDGQRISGNVQIWFQFKRFMENKMEIFVSRI